jgi:hypothetical protein
LINESGFAVVNVGDDGNITKCAFGHELLYKKIN